MTALDYPRAFFSPYPESEKGKAVQLQSGHLGSSLGPEAACRSRWIEDTPEAAGGGTATDGGRTSSAR